MIRRDPGFFDISVYRVQGADSSHLGDVEHLRVGSWLTLDDDGVSVIEHRQLPAGAMRWPVSASSPTDARDASRALQTPATPGSRHCPLPDTFRFAARAVENRPDVDKVQLIERATGKDSLIPPFWSRGCQVSPDRRFLASRSEREARVVDARQGTLIPLPVADAERLVFDRSGRRLAVCTRTEAHVFDARTGQREVSLEFDQISNVRFEADGALLRVQTQMGASLVPLEPALIRRFANWLVPEKLSPEEECRFGLGDEGCR